MVVCASSLAQEPLPQEVRDALTRATEVEVLSVSPNPNDYVGLPRFHHYPRLGSRKICGSLAERLSLELLAGMKGVVEVSPVMCFNPRHGLRCNGSEFLICFECLQILAFPEQGKPYLILTDQRAQEAFEGVVAEMGPVWQAWRRDGDHFISIQGVDVKLPAGVEPEQLEIRGDEMILSRVSSSASKSAVASTGGQTIARNAESRPGTLEMRCHVESMSTLRPSLFFIGTEFSDLSVELALTRIVYQARTDSVRHKVDFRGYVENRSGELGLSFVGAEFLVDGNQPTFLSILRDVTFEAPHPNPHKATP